MHKLYALTEEELSAVMRLTDASRLLAAALPPAYTTTPIGTLNTLADAVSRITIFAKEMGECDECQAAPVPTIRCEECDTHRCHRCYYRHRH